MAIPHYTELNAALARPIDGLNPETLDTDFTISDELLDLFRSDDASVGNTRADAKARFDAARKLYQTVTNNPANIAIFYKLRDKSNAKDLYQEARYYIRELFKIYVNGLGHVPSAQEKVNFFREIRDGHRGIHNPSPQLDAAMRDLAGALRNQNLAGLTHANINAWFSGYKGAVTQFAEDRYFGVDAQAARAVGAIYAPENHNWGTNLAWALALTRQSRDIHVISDLVSGNALRSSRNPPPPHPLPSAFALEVSIAIMMDYTLTFNVDGTVDLIHPNNLPHSNTQGNLGAGILPTANQQIDIFDACVLDAKRHHNTLAAYLANKPSQFHMRWRQKLTTPPLDTKTTFDNLRTAMRTPQLFQAIAADLERKRGGIINKSATLRQQFHDTCTGINVFKKTDLADTLEYLRANNNGQLNLILGALRLSDHRELRAMLGAAPFQGDANYDNLRTQTRNAQLTAIAADLESKRGGPINKSATLRNDFHNICTGANGVAKQDLADTLEHLRVNNNGQLNLILGALRPSDHRELRAMLGAAPFQGDANYDNLRTRTRNVQLTAIAADLESKRGGPINKSATLRNEFHNICTGANGVAKQDLADTLEHLRVNNNGQLNLILGALRLSDHRELRAMLGAAPFQGDANYDNLRTRARTAEISAITTDLTTKLNSRHHAQLKQHVHDTLIGNNDNAKQELIDALIEMPQINRGAILAGLSAREKNDLHQTLQAGAFADGKYNNLKGVVAPRIELQAYARHVRVRERDDIKINNDESDRKIDKPRH